MLNAEISLDRKSNRIQEIKNYAKASGIKRIGIAHCIAVTKEAKIVKEYLSKEFEVHSIDCKIGKLTKDVLLNIEGEKIICNPSAQAKYLENNNTELNIAMGLCVGHDMIFNKKSKAPVSSLLVKDRINKHNIFESIKDISEKD